MNQYLRRLTEQQDQQYGDDQSSAASAGFGLILGVGFLMFLPVLFKETERDFKKASDFQRGGLNEHEKGQEKIVIPNLKELLADPEDSSVLIENIMGQVLVEDSDLSFPLRDLLLDPTNPSLRKNKDAIMDSILRRE